MQVNGAVGDTIREVARWPAWTVSATQLFRLNQQREGSRQLRGGCEVHAGRGRGAGPVPHRVLVELEGRRWYAYPDLAARGWITAPADPAEADSHRGMVAARPEAARIGIAQRANMHLLR